MSSDDDHVEINGFTFWRVQKRHLLAGDPDAEGEVLMPLGTHHVEHDDYREFPLPPNVQGFSNYIASGISRHAIESGSATETREVRKPARIVESAPGRLVIEIDDEVGPQIAARDLFVFGEMDWYGECFHVLEANGWREHGLPTQNFVDAIGKVVAAQGLEQELARLSDEDRDLRCLELAATHLAEPFSRVWYAANMMALYYLYQDDLRLGYLWSEYQAKLRFEAPAMRQLKNAAKARENGSLGGQAQEERARKRYDVLDRLSVSKFDDMLRGTDRQRRRLARQIASDYDRSSSDAPLFLHNGSPLREAWYDDWVTHFLVDVAPGIANARRDASR